MKKTCHNCNGRGQVIASWGEAYDCHACLNSGLRTVDAGPRSLHTQEPRARCQGDDIDADGAR